MRVVSCATARGLPSRLWPRSRWGSPGAQWFSVSPTPFCCGRLQSATASFPFPLAGGFSPVRWGLESARSDPSRFRAADFQAVLPGYFDTLRTSLIAGRTFTDADNALERGVVIIDQMLAAKAFPGESAVGKRILVRSGTPEAESVKVIGVVAHQRQTSLADPGREQIYLTDGFRNHGFVRRWAVRTEGNPAQYTAAIRARIAKISPGLLVTEMQPMDKYIEKAQAVTRFSLLLISAFAGVSALLAGVGLYVVLATMVRMRTAEIGVRMAFGAKSTILKENGGRGETGLRRNRAGGLLVVGQVALSLVLLAGSILLIRTFVALRNVDPGMQVHNILTMRMSFAGEKYSTTAAMEKYETQATQRIESLPGVIAAAPALVLPLQEPMDLPFVIEGRPLAGGDTFSGDELWRFVGLQSDSLSNTILQNQHCASVATHVSLIHSKHRWSVLIFGQTPGHAICLNTIGRGSLTNIPLCAATSVWNEFDMTSEHGREAQNPRPTS